MKVRMLLLIIAFTLTSCAVPNYVLPQKTEVAKLCHVFIVNDYNDVTSWLSTKSMTIGGIKWKGSAPTLTSQGYNVYPAPIGPIHLTFQFKHDGLGSRGAAETAVVGNCKQGEVFFAYVQSKIVTSAAWPLGVIEMESRSKEVADPVANELLEIFRTNQPVFFKQLANYVFNGGPANYRPKQ